MKILTTNKGDKIIVDDEDFNILSKYTWYINMRGYPQYDSRKAGIEIRFLMHTFLMKPTKGKEVDHINQNKLDNRKINLRICSHSENTRNRVSKRKTISGYKGVYPGIRCNLRPWKAQLILNGKDVYLGAYKTKKEAAIAYNEGALKYHGEYASLNKI